MLNYERAVKNDFEAVLSLLERAFQNDKALPGFTHEICETPEKLHEYISSRRVWKVLNGDALVGCLIAYIDSGKEGVLACIAVSPNYQRAGFGSEALSWLERQFPATTVWHCLVSSVNAQTQRFFEKNGYFRSSDVDDASAARTIYKKDLNACTDDPNGGCLYKDLPKHGFEAEFFEDLIKVENVRTERIISRGQSSPASGYYDQSWTEIVLVLCGSAQLEIEGRVYELRAGDWRCIHPHEKHRVLKTSCEPPCVWYAIHISE